RPAWLPPHRSLPPRLLSRLADPLEEGPGLHDRHQRPDGGPERLAEPDQPGTLRWRDPHRPLDLRPEDLVLRLHGLHLPAEVVPAGGGEGGQEAAEEVRHRPSLTEPRVTRPAGATPNLSRGASGRARGFCT